MEIFRGLSIISVAAMGIIFMLSFGRDYAITVPVRPNVRFPETSKIMVEKERYRIIERGSLIIKNPTRTEKFFVARHNAQGQLDIDGFSVLYFLLLNAALLIVCWRKDNHTFLRSEWMMKIIVWGGGCYLVLTDVLQDSYTSWVVGRLTDGLYTLNTQYDFYVWYYLAFVASLLMVNVKKGKELQKEQELVV